jgi:acetolactate synthase-1/2/3 large subunit
MDRTSFENYTVESNETSGIPREAARLMSNSQKPVVVAGALAARRKWRENLDHLNIPIFTTVAGKGAVDETGPYAAGVFTNSGGPLSPESRILPMADLIVGVGLRTTEILDVKHLPAPLILFDELSGKAPGLEALFEACVESDDMLEALELLSAKQWGDEAISAAKGTLRTKIEVDRWLPAGALRLAQKILPASTRFVLDTGNFCTIAEHTLIARNPLDVMGSSCGRSMGVALPTAVGAALAARDIPLATVLGDGGIGMYPEVIRLAVKEKLPQLILLMKDGFLSSVRKEALKKNVSGEFLRVPCVSWTGVFQSFGCAAERIESFNGLENALGKWNLDRAAVPRIYFRPVSIHGHDRRYSLSRSTHHYPPKIRDEAAYFNYRQRLGRPPPRPQPGPTRLRYFMHGRQAGPARRGCGRRAAQVSLQ